MKWCYFFLAYWLSNQLNFSVAVRIYKIHVFDEAYFLSTIMMSMAAKLFTVVACCEDLSPININDISTEWPCGMDKIKAR